MTVPNYTTWDRDLLEDTLDEAVVNLKISQRTANALEKIGVIRIRDLLQKTKGDLMSIPNFGEKSYMEVMLALREIGFYSPPSS